ncbi:MAG: long-chain fatty acid--CoA ligase [Gammaproteobacteria bacterium]|nr:long-chain fatty acid--CoA ligase [Gammaproteobacteria bacterium]
MDDARLENSNLVDEFQKNMRTNPRTIALRFGGRDIDYGTLDQLTDHIAAGLYAQDIRQGDRVALYCINSDAFVIAYTGILKAGATVVPLNLMLNPKEIEYMLNDCGARGIIYFEAFAPQVKAFRDHVPDLQVFIGIGAAKSHPSDLDWQALLQTGGAPPRYTYNPREDLVAIIYTSGTTGKPKGVMLTHRNFLFDCGGVQESLQFKPGADALLVVLPMFHSFAATVGVVTPLLFGLTILPVPKFDPNLVADTIALHQATIFLGVPSMYNVLLNLPDAAIKKFSSLRFCVSGGASMPVELMNRFEARFNKLIYEGDGPTECCPVTCVNPIGGIRKPASVGLPIAGVEMKILDENGQELPNDQAGEICVRGNNVMKGYWNRPEDTRASFHGQWYRTGDIGTRDSDGYFYIIDRIKDLVIVNGMNVYPRVIEEILYQHPAISEAAVIGEPAELQGEIPVAYVVLKPQQNVGAAELRKFCGEHLGRHEIPRKVFFIAALPKNAAGKTLKRELRKQGELERGVDSRAPEQPA